MTHSENYLCAHCDKPLHATSEGVMHDVDGTSNDAQSSCFACPACGRQYQRIIIPRAKRVGTKLVDDHRVVWMGDKPRTA